MKRSTRFSKNLRRRSQSFESPIALMCVTMKKHVAIKCTYNNGDEGVFVGFSGTCSEDIIKWNIKNGRVWCNQKDCECRKYYDSGFKGKRPSNDLCYESVLFRDWQYGAGWYHTGLRAETPIHLSNVGKGKIAILTTRFPGDEEIDRKIIGLFKIGEVKNEPGKETMLMADRTFAIRLQMEEAKNLFFWDYYSTKVGAKWGYGLIRYLEDNQIARILVDLRETLRDEKAKGIIDTLLTKDFANIFPLPASGPHVKRSGNRTRRIAIARKYGASKFFDELHRIIVSGKPEANRSKCIRRKGRVNSDVP